MRRFVSKPLRFSVGDLEYKTFRRADLVFRGVDHSGLSFEARVFLNNRDADAKTERSPENGYAGSFYIFGHGGCFGDVGHCDVPIGPRRQYDRRRPHPLTPAEVHLTVTDALRQVAAKNGAEITVTVVPVVREAPSYVKGQPQDVLKITGVSLVTYD